VDVLVCSSDGCQRLATETLFLRDQPGHVHDCPEHAHDLREWCDVVSSSVIVDGRCQADPCTGNVWLWFAEPRALEV